MFHLQIQDLSLCQKERMLKQKSENSLKKLFLMQFTKELIKNSYKFEIQKKRIFEVPIQIPIKIKKEFIQKISEKKMEITPLNVPQVPRIFPEASKTNIPQVSEKLIEKPKQIQITLPRRIIPNVLRIPEPRLPEAFSYLKPLPTSINIELGKLNPLIKDSNVRIIECNGPDENIIVEGNMGRKPTGIILNQEEINEVINNFSEKTKIPISTGIYRVVIGKFLFLAIISEVVSSKFIIRKMA